MMHATNSDMIPVRTMTAADIIEFARQRQRRFEAEAREAQRARKAEEARRKYEAEQQAIRESEEYKRKQEMDKLDRKIRRQQEMSRRLDEWLAEQKSKEAQEIAQMRRDLGVEYRADFNRIVRRMAKAHNIRPSQIIAKGRRQSLVMARQGVMYWAARLTSLSYPQIARRLGGLDHSTVLHGARVYPQKRANMGRTLRPVR